jgi:antitoxin (DNA-binding transcriptional repressor) of toxin-antitoxin stability system
MEREGRKVTVDVRELHDGYDRFLALAFEGVEVVITEAGKVTARILPPDPGARPRPRRDLKIEPRRRTAPRRLPPLTGLHIPPEEIDRIVREWR